MSGLTLPELAALGVERLRTVGTGKRLESFRKFGITNLHELLAHYPRRWVDRTTEATVESALEGTDALVVGEIRSVQAPPRRGKAPARVVAVIGDGTGRLSLVFFNQPWRERQLQPGTWVAAFGRVSRFQGAKQMTAPTIDVLGAPDERPRPIVPIYQIGRAHV